MQTAGWTLRWVRRSCCPAPVVHAGTAVSILRGCKCNMQHVTRPWRDTVTFSETPDSDPISTWLITQEDIFAYWNVTADDLIDDMIFSWQWLWRLLLSCDAMWTGTSSPVFQRNVLHPSSGYTLKIDGGIFLLNVSNNLTDHVASHRRKQ